MAANATLTVPPHVLTYLAEQKTLTLATASTAAFRTRRRSLRERRRRRSTSGRDRRHDRRPHRAELDGLVRDRRVRGRLAETKGIQGSRRGARRSSAPTRSAGSSACSSRSSRPSRRRARATSRSSGSRRPSMRFIEGASGAEGSDQALGFDYHRDLVYSVFHDLPPGEVVGDARREPPGRAGGAGHGDRAPGRSRRQVLHRRRRRGRGRPRGRRRAANRRATRARPVLRRDGDPARHAAHRDGAGGLPRRRCSPWSATPSALSSPSRSAPRRTSIATIQQRLGEIGGERTPRRDGGGGGRDRKPRRSAAPTSGARWGPSRPG